jgi:hypothetical protein
MLVLIIDDDHTRHDTFERYLGTSHECLHAFNYEEAIAILNYNHVRIGLVCFDNDLGTKLEGSDIASYILNELDIEKFPAQVIVHSMNPVAADNIASKTKTAGIPTSVRSFSVEMVKQLAAELTPQ